MRERHDESRISAHRFRWLAGLLAGVIGLLLWQNWTLRTELRRLNNHVEEAVATAEDASEYARRAWDAADRNGDQHYSEIRSKLQQEVRHDAASGQTYTALPGSDVFVPTNAPPLNR